uniref:helix-turn-helix domain-containing protein n=1 Tax=uncultured Draconibacterium sp. TaxID=1573823 RepID=UPI003216218A
METKSIQLTNLTPEEFQDIINSAVLDAMQLNLLSIESEQKTAKYLTRGDTAFRLRISLPTLHEWTKKGKIKAYKIGGRVLYRENEVDASLTAIESLR